MSFCSKCGYKIEEGDKFCINCGQPVDTGNKVQDNVQANVATLQINPNLKESVKIFWRMLINPSQTAKEFINKGNKNLFIIITTAIALLQGLFGMWKVNQIVSQLKNIIANFMNILGEIVGENITKHDMIILQNQLGNFIDVNKISYSKVFFQCLGLSLLSIGVIIFLMYIISSVFYKSNIDHFKLIKTVVISYCPIIYGELIAILLGYINSKVALFIFIINVLISIGCLYQNTKELVLNEGEIAIFSVSISISILIIIINVLGFKFLESQFLNIFNMLKQFSY